MKDLFLELDHRTLLLLEFIGLEAQALDTNIYLVGGCVRDLMLKRENLDLDIVVEGDATALAKSVAEKRNGKITVYPVFKTATVTFSNGIVIDFATARKETYATSGALPQISAGDIHDDLFRRDFTINALAISLSAHHLGKLIDDCNGLQDIKNKTIRILHKKSFIDDPTRILRAVRFEKRLKFKIETATLKLLRSVVRANANARVKPPRWFEEFRKILKEEDVPGCIQQLDKLGVMTFISKNFVYDPKLLKKIQKNLASAKKQPADIDGSLVYMMALVDSPQTKTLPALLQGWNLTREEVKKIVAAVESKDRMSHLSTIKCSNSQVFRTLEGLSPEALLFLHGLTSSHHCQRYIDVYQEKLSAVSLEINGEDVKSLGVQEGRAVKMILDEVLNQKLDGKIYNRQQELELALSLITSSGKAVKL